MAAIVIPAHNEAAVISRTLGTLTRDAEPGEFEIVVACNGCTDDTADIASMFTGVSVLSIPQPSKREAVAAAHRTASAFPRIVLDADVDIDAASIRALCEALRRPGIEAAGPARTLPSDGVSPLVRGYYAVWERLPNVQNGLFGRGVIALTEDGHRRVTALPPAMSDDLAVSEAFSPTERVIVEHARVVVRPPRTARDLMRRRIRVNTGNAQLDQTGGRTDEARTSIGDLVRMARREPRLVPAVIVFLGFTVLAKIAARRRIRAGDYDTWLRDESSRT